MSAGIALFTLGWVGGVGGDTTLLNVSGISVRLEEDLHIRMKEEETNISLAEDDTIQVGEDNKVTIENGIRVKTE